MVTGVKCELLPLAWDGCCVFGSYITFIVPFDLMGVEPDDSGVIITNGTLGSCF